MDTTQIIEALLRTSTNISFIRAAGKRLDVLLEMKQPLLQIISNLETSIDQLEYAIKNFRSSITNQFINTITKSPLMNIPKAPVILWAALAQAIRSLKIALIKSLQHCAELLHISLQVIPEAYSIANELNTFFAKITGNEIINPQFMHIVRIMLTATLPDINEGMKILITNLQADIPELQEQE
jgi:hypothetical protein